MKTTYALFWQHTHSAFKPFKQLQKLSTQRIVQLTPPLISPNHIKEKIICIRAHRERIFNVSMQIHDGKHICHNYGQGGAGWTFLFGCVNESLRQFEQHLENHPNLKNKPICVIGAGCYGLLTAITLIRKGYSVRIVAKDQEHITSYKSAGFFFPRPRKMSTPDEKAIFEKLGMESYAIYKDIIQGKHPFIKSGPKILPAYYGLDIDPGFAPYISQKLVSVPEKVTIHFGKASMYEVMEYKAVFINSTEILKELYRAIENLGIPIIKDDIQSWNDVTESIIFNCAGFGAKDLACDKRLVPVQGHLITLKNQPSMEQLQYMLNVKVTMTNSLGRARDELIYYAPKDNGILGITFIRGEESLTSNSHEFDRLLQRCHDFFGAEVIV